ncbi:MAG: DUF2442 domain-containing protein [Pirellulales bacterium]
MLKDIVAVRPVGDFRLFIQFEDGLEGTIDIGELVSFQGVFEPLKNLDEFARVYVNSELGSIEWPNGADLDPDVLYDRIASVAKDESHSSAKT